MSNTRAPGQKLISVPMNEKFIEKIDAALPEMGYSDRSSFIRDAIVEKIRLAGIEVAQALSLAPSRTGKGGRPSRPYPEKEAGSAEMKDSRGAQWGKTAAAPVKAQKSDAKKMGKYRIPSGSSQGITRNYKAQ